ncbi:MAG: hypothetical protein ACJ76Y_23390 [Thermoanaerobaculia bacterium]
MKSPLAEVFDEILRELESNPQLRARIERHFAPADAHQRTDRTGPRSRNRRAEPTIDPYALMAHSEASLRSALEPLSSEQLKDVISSFSLDSSRLALKWKDRNRLVELIVTTVRARMEKGDAFRA